MTDTTDIAALREASEIGESSDYMTWPKVDPAKLKRVLEQLEAERQRADNKKAAIRNIKNLSQQQMRDFCTRYSKDNNDGTSAFFDPNDVEWVEGVLSSDYFLSIFSTRDRALKYLLDEINIRKNDGLPYADYEYLINNQEENPIVFVINNGKPVLWDGFHRVAAAIYRGDTIYSIFAQAPVDNKGWEDAACAKHKENALLRDELAALKGDQVPVAYFAAAPNYGWDMFKNKEDAIATCQAEIDACRDCRDDGWDDDVSRVCWGVVLQKAEGFDQQGVHTSNSHHTYQTCDYSLQPEPFTAPQKLSNLPYDVLFNAIGKAVNIQGQALSISVKAFKEAIEAAGGIVKDGE